MPIFDQGYQHWNGPLTGHSWRWLAVARHGVRTTLKGRVVKLMLLAAWVPALALVVVLALWGLLEQQAESVLAFMKQVLPPEVVAHPSEYRKAVWAIVYSFFYKAELACAVFLVLVVGPNLISRDLRFNALPLYFSRPLRRIDYFLGKLGVIGFFLAATTIVPAAVAYVFGVAFSLDLGVLRDTHWLLWNGTLYGLIITVSAGTLMLAFSSLTRRSIYVAITWAGFCFLTLTISGILIGIRFHAEQEDIVRLHMEKWLQEHPPPEGVEMSGVHVRRLDRRGPDEEKNKQIDKWFRDWNRARNRSYGSTEDALAQQIMVMGDWRHTVSYTSNLDRLGDALLRTDEAWVTIGRTVEKPRAAFGPIANIHAGGKLPAALTQPANDRMLANQMVKQFPWYWSAGVLLGLWVISVLILSTRVKSLDRLK